MANSLKNVKSKINRKIKNSILCAVTAVFVFIIGYTLLFHAAIKTVSLEDISVTANVYSLAELTENPADHVPALESVTIFSDEEDSSKKVDVNIPKLGEITLTEDTITKCKYATVVSINSDHFLKTIKQEIKDHTIYITAFKTTLFNNKAKDYQNRICSLEFQEINKIVFVNDTGTETVLWSR